MHAIIDIGSNTIRLVIYKINDDSYNILLNKKEMAGLASYVDGNMMSLSGINKACAILIELKKIAQDLGIADIYPFATAALRNVTNSAAAVREIEERTSLKIHVISGQTEAKLDFIGAAKTVNLASGLLIDIGGASTELVSYENMIIQSAISLPIGSLSAYKKYVQHFFPNKNEQKKIANAVLHLLNKEDTASFNDSYTDICGVGGTIRSSQKLYNNTFNLSSQNQCIQTKYISNIIKKYLSDKKKDAISRTTLDTLLDVVPERIRTILPGMIILKTLIKQYNAQNIFVSNAGVREGYLTKFILNKLDDIEV